MFPSKLFEVFDCLPHQLRIVVEATEPPVVLVAEPSAEFSSQMVVIERWGIEDMLLTNQLNVANGAFFTEAARTRRVDDSCLLPHALTSRCLSSFRIPSVVFGTPPNVVLLGRFQVLAHGALAIASVAKCVPLRAGLPMELVAHGTSYTADGEGIEPSSGVLEAPLRPALPPVSIV